MYTLMFCVLYISVRCTSTYYFLLTECIRVQCTKLVYVKKQSKNNIVIVCIIVIIIYILNQIIIIIIITILLLYDMYVTIELY